MGADLTGFSMSKLTKYKKDELREFRWAFEERAKKARKIAKSSNESVGYETRKDKPDLARIARHEGLREAANAIADEARNKAFACEVEEELRGS